MVSCFTRTSFLGIGSGICISYCSKCEYENAGVNFVGLDGEGKDRVVVIGDGVDAVKLTKCLRKKLGHADIVSLGEHK